MFTDNYIKFQKLKFESAAYSEYTSLVNADGTSCTAYVLYSWGCDLGQWIKYARCRSITAQGTGRFPGSDKIYPGVYFGSGSTPPTKSDYTLESPITSGLNITNPSSLVWVNNGNGAYSCVSDFIVQNATGNAITINEIGIFVPTGANASGSVTNSITLNNVLMERTVLSEPITIPAGEAKLVTYKITFNQTLS